VAASIVVLLGALLLFAVGCGDKTVDTGSIEKSIKDQVVGAGAPVTKVDCPSDVKSEKGATFKCDVSFENGGTGKVEVTQTGAGRFQYTTVPGSLQVPGSVFEKDIQQSLSQKGITNATVNCPDTVIVKVGTYAVCDVTGANGAKSKVKFTFTDSSGTVDESSVETTS
jgi:hypothetical protein